NSVAEVNVSATAKDSTATISGVGTVNLSNGANNIDIIVTAQNGSQRTYRLNIVRQSGGPTYSGTGTTVTTTSTNNSSNASTYGPGGTGSSSPSGTSSSSGSTVVLIGPGN
ncbi:MAG: cadherin-like beta sandwich domain-containing protein, partial [Phoenicibacter congonensis]|nr:cadherin-like beta sandwich domain-containing protein [Phoenicibacter congonensis]